MPSEAQGLSTITKFYNQLKYFTQTTFQLKEADVETM